MTRVAIIVSLLDCLPLYLRRLTMLNSDTTHPDDNEQRREFVMTRGNPVQRYHGYSYFGKCSTDCTLAFFTSY